MRSISAAPAALLLLCSSSATAQEFVNQKRFPSHPNHKSARELIEEKYARHEEILTGMIEQRQAELADHESGRKLLSEDEVNHRVNHIGSLQRKLVGHQAKDPKTLQLEIEEEIKLYEKMMYGEEFQWTSEGMILKEP